jgi:hypothetical protein
MGMTTAGGRLGLRAAWRACLCVAAATATATAGCNLRPGECTGTSVATKRADGSGWADVVLDAVVTARGRPVPGAKVTYWLVHSTPGINIGSRRTGGDGLARYPLTESVQSGRVSVEEARRATAYVAEVVAFTGGSASYCGSEGMAPLHWGPAW